MAQKTNLNVAPYYDDFEASDNFNRVLFRPGFAIQARELTQLQSALQNQIEKHGSHIFKEGAMVIPGQISLNKLYYSLKLASTFGGETIDPSQYYNATTPVTITGATSGVTARVIGFDVATTTDQPTLYLQYIKTGTDGETGFFADGENITANTGITHTTAYSSNVVSATTFTSTFTKGVSSKANLISSTGPAAAVGSAAHIEAGTYYIRGNFVECAAETLVLDKYNNQPSYRVGFTVTESLVTPESDSTLLDNATGSSNFAAKGAHRLKINLALAKLDRDSTADGSFVQLLDTKEGNIQSITRVTEYEILEDTLARRTFDESGNYTVRPFQIQMKESVTVNEFEGTYSTGAATDDGFVASDNLLVAQVSTGKAYVKGYELDKISPTFKDVLKARDFDTINAGQTLVNTGNFALINNVYGQPEISPISGETTAYKDIVLISDTRTSASSTIPDIKHGNNSSNIVGLARARAFEHSTGTIGTDDAQYKLFLFDIKMITYIGLSDQTSLTDGAQIIGQTSGATGRVVLNDLLSSGVAGGSITNGIRIALTDVVGRFQVGEKLTSSDSGETDQILENSGNTDVTVTSYNGSVQTDFKFEDVRGVFQESTSSTAAQNFQGSIVLQSPARRARQINGLVIDGTDAGGANANSLLGQGEAGDDNANSGGLNLEDIKTARLNDADKNNALEKLPKQVIKTLLTATNDGVTDTQFTIRRQFVGSTNSSGAITFNAGSNETFVSHSEKDYVLSILTAGGGTGSAGQLVSVASTISGVGGTSITITDSTVLGSAAKVRLTATLLKTSVVAKSKTTRLMKQINVINASGSATNFGTRVGDAEISLGRVDAFKMVGVFDSQDSSTNASAPELTLGTITGAFTRGEKITGSSSGATARIIDTTSPMSFVSTNDKTFTTSDTISGESSSATAAVSAVTTGSPVITSSFVLDTGQRDNYYDISRIVRKKGSAAPIGRLLVVYDYLEHGAGDVFTVDSYSDVAKQMEYVDIPNFTASKVDPDEPIPSGDFPLTDTYDSRPAVDSVTGMSESVSSLDAISGKSFDFFSRSFGGTGGTTVDTLKPGSFIQSDFEFFLPRISTITLSKEGDFMVRDGQSAEVPQPPKIDDDSMLIATLKVPPFTFEPDSVEIIRSKHQRYTMKDIGKLENRIDHLEYYTSLTLLERDAESFEVTDAQGLNRFKSGFMVDNFKGHRTGDTIHKDYKCAMDFEAGELRPQHRSKAIGLSELATNDSERTSLGYQKTGDLITLPYTEEVLTTQPYATQLERVTPYLTSSWIGRITLSPSGDTWFETEVAAQLVVNREGDYDAVLARERNNLGTIWNSWQTTWSGVVDSRAEVELFDRTETSVTRAGSGVRRFRRTRTTETVRTNQRRVGVNTEVTLRIDRENQGFRTIGRAAIPIMRSNTITFTGEGFKPNTRIYPFFNKVAVSNNVTPSSGFSSDSTIVAGSPLITNSTGQIGGTFVIPDPKVAGNPRFPTGDIEFRLTSSSTNASVTAKTAVGTAGTALYHANGFLETIQETIISTRNADITRRSLNQTRSNTSSSVVSDRTEDLGVISWADPPQPPTPPVRTQPVTVIGGTEFTEQFPAEEVDDADGGGDDPLAMTFMVEPNAETSGRPTSGRFITSVDIFHGEKDDALPVTVELRNTVNGYPGPKVLPFGRVTKQVADINISSTAATATTYTFPSPVYVETDKEYCIVVISNVPTHKVWISRMGEVDVGGTRTVSEQPHTGVLFKGHNNRAWAMSPTEDLKFTIKCAKFDTSAAGNVTLENDAVPNVTLVRDPLTFSHGSNVIKVNHPDHHMYSTANNVTIDNVKSGASTTLSGAITASSTSITLTSGTNFDDTSGKFSRTSSSTYFIKIDDEIISYTTISGNVISGAQRGQGSTTAATHADGSTVELYQAWTVPFTEIIKTHTAIANIGIDSYTISTTASASVGSTGDDVNVGGTTVTATENALMDYFQTLIGTLELPETSIAAQATLTSGTSPDGTQSSFTSGRTSPNTVPVITYPLNDNFKFEQPRLIASSINETNELSSLKSYSTSLKLRSASTALSPVIDTERATVFAIANRINNIDSSSDVYPTTSFVPSTEPEGDQNAAIYLTKQVTLAASATSLKVILAAHRPATSEIKVLFKTLGVDESIDFQAKGFTFFNDDGSADTTVQPSADRFDFQEYVFTAGVTDDGIGDQLPEFVAFQVKIIMQGTNCAEPPRLRDLRVLALGT